MGIGYWVTWIYQLYLLYGGYVVDTYLDTNRLDGWMVMVVIIEYHMAHVTKPNYQHAASSISSIYAASSISVGERLSFAMMQFSNKSEDFHEKKKCLLLRL